MIGCARTNHHQTDKPTYKQEVFTLQNSNLLIFTIGTEILWNIYHI